MDWLSRFYFWVDFILHDICRLVPRSDCRSHIVGDLWSRSLSRPCLLSNYELVHGERSPTTLLSLQLSYLLYFLHFIFPQGSEYTSRLALLFSAAAVAGAVGGLIAFGALQLDILRLEGWQWLYVFEGLLSTQSYYFSTYLISLSSGVFTMIAGVLTFIWLPDSPAAALCLSPQERELARLRIPQKREPSTQWEGLSRVLKSPIAWSFAVVYLLIVIPLYTIGYYLPTLIAEMGFGTLTSNLLTVPVYASAFVCIILFSRVADVYQCHGAVVVTCSLIAFVGFGGLVIGTHFSVTSLSFVFITVANVGVMASVPPLLAWVSQRYYGRWLVFCGIFKDSWPILFISQRGRARCRHCFGDFCREFRRNHRSECVWANGFVGYRLQRGCCRWGLHYRPFVFVWTQLRFGGRFICSLEVFRALSFGLRSCVKYRMNLQKDNYIIIEKAHKYRFVMQQIWQMHTRRAHFTLHPITWHLLKFYVKKTQIHHIFDFEDILFWYMITSVSLLQSRNDLVQLDPTNPLSLLPKLTSKLSRSSFPIYELCEKHIWPK